MSGIEQFWEFATTWVLTWLMLTCQRCKSHQNSLFRVLQSNANDQDAVLEEILAERGLRLPQLLAPERPYMPTKQSGSVISSIELQMTVRVNKA